MDNSARPVWNQLVHAVQEFFPESGILDDHGMLMDASMMKPSLGSRRQSSGSTQGYGFGSTHGQRSQQGGDLYGLRRVETGLSSIVGAGNGDRPGGFVLVIDGAALDVVSVALNPYVKWKGMLIRL